MPNNRVKKAVMGQTSTAPEPPTSKSIRSDTLRSILKKLGIGPSESDFEPLNPLELMLMRRGLLGTDPKVDPRLVNPSFSPYSSKEALTRGDIALMPEYHGIRSLEDDENRKRYEGLLLGLGSENYPIVDNPYWKAKRR